MTAGPDAAPCRWVPVRDLAGCPGMPKSARAVRRAAARLGLRVREGRAPSGHRRIEVDTSTLPLETLQSVQEEHLPAATGALQLQLLGSSPSSTARLTDKQREIEGARRALLREVDRLADLAGVEEAIRRVVAAARAGTLPEELQRQVALANARAGKKSGTRTLSVSSIKRWRAALRRGPAALAPKNPPRRLPPWCAAFLDFYGKPQKPSAASVVRVLRRPGVLPAGVSPPSEQQARRFLKKIGEVYKQRGRMGPRELKNLRPFVRRDFSKLLPTDVYTADGHSFDAEVAHPEHGRPFRPEVTTIIDVATRKAVGWSISLSESALAVLDALRHACTTNGIPAIFYVDKGSGYVNDMMSAPATGLMARLGIEMTHSIPRNSQARGVMERFHGSVLVPFAKQLPTYMGADMDPEAKQIAFRRTRKDGMGLVAWPRFVEAVGRIMADYNARPHKALGGRTPDAAWEQAVAAGAAPMLPEPDPDLFRPQELRQVRRGEVSLWGNRYFSAALEQFHGRTVSVGYDVHDPARVWVRDDEGRLVCEAGFEANKRDYYPMPFVEAAREKRARGRLRRLEAKRGEVLAEREGTAALPAELPAPSPERVAELRREYAHLFDTDEDKARAPEPVPLQPCGRPVFKSDSQFFEWLRDHPDQVDEMDEAWLADFRKTNVYRYVYAPDKARHYQEEGGRACDGPL